MDISLRNKIAAAIGGGAIAIASVLIPHLEGTEYTPYRDVVGVLTVCNGITGPDVIDGKTYTQEECDTLLRKHLKPFAASVGRSVKVPMTETQEAALISFSFNVGAGAFERSTLLKHLNAGKYKQACDDLRQWVYAGKKKWKGLMDRRDVEYEVCTWSHK